MRIEDEIKTRKYHSDIQRAHLNVLFSASWLRAKIAFSLKPFGLTSEQFNVLRIVRGAGPKGIRVKDISVRMLDRNSNTTRIINKLEVKSYLQRSTSERDRRELVIVLTNEGHELLRQIDTDWEQNTPHKSNLSIEECRTLCELLDKMRD